MAHTVSVIAGAQDRTSRTAFLGDRNRPLKHMQRANIVLLSAERLPVLEVVRRASVSRPAVRRWQVRYAEQGVDGLLRDKTRKPGRARLPAATVARVLALTCSEPPGAVLSIDEKSQIQTLDRTQPGLPLKPGRCGTITHDYKRNGTTALFAALNTFDGTMVGRCMPRHTHKHKEFATFLKAAERAVPAGKVIHAIVDNYATPSTRRCWSGWPTTALGLSLHTHVGFLDQRRRRFLLGHYAQAHPAGRLQVRRRSSGRHHPLHPRAQQGGQALRLDQARRHHRRQARRAP